MNENNELLTYIYQVASMGVKSTTTLINTIKNTNNKIKKIVEEELKEYESFLKESKRLLKKNKIAPKDKGFMVELMSKMGIKMEMLKDNSDPSIAEMLIQGFTMGVVEMEHKIDRYKENADRSIIKLAKRLLKYQQESIEILKPYL